MSKVSVIVVIAIAVLVLWSRRDARPQPPMIWDERRITAVAADLDDAKGTQAPPHALTGAKRILLYTSASWCPACREFTPELVEFYRTHGGGREFQVLLISDDENELDRHDYMRDYKMPWWGVRIGSASNRLLATCYPAPTIPRLVLLDGEGHVLADGTDHGAYRGPTAVLEALAAGR